MKKIGMSLAVAVMAALVIFSCTKQAREESGGFLITPENIAKDASFQALNSAMNRFDPQYLRLVYKESKTIEQLTRQSNDLLLQLNTNPDNPGFQQQLATFYHFRDIGQLKDYSARISSALKELDKKYDFSRSLFPGNKAQVFYQARRLVAKAALETNTPQRRVNGLWSEFVDAYFSEFGYFNYVYDEGLEAAGDGGGGDECNGESCCYEKQICYAQAKSDFWKNLAYYGGGGAGSLAAAGGLGGLRIGAFFGPQGGGIGAIVGTALGALSGGVSGATIAYNIYAGSKEVCNIKYNQCIAAKTKT
jgi:hypothetical protein